MCTLTFTSANCTMLAARNSLRSTYARSLVAYSTVVESAKKYASEVPRCTATINGREVSVPEGTSILAAAQRLGIFIPTLCTHPKLPTTPGTCRLCLVENKGRLIPACATPLTEGMEVSTDTPAVQENITGLLKLLRARHPKDCMTCDVAGKCEFQDLLSRYNVGEMGATLRHASHEWDDSIQFEGDEPCVDSTPGAIHIDLDKCLRCGRCVTACNVIQNMGVIGMVGRGDHRHPAPEAPKLEASKCIECGQCSLICPVGAIVERSEWREVLDELEHGRKIMVAMTAPAVRVAIGEEVGLAPGSITIGQTVSGLRQVGFDKVLDVDFAADLTIMEEGTELIGRLAAAWGLKEPDEHTGPLPMFTSCCPAWITMVEKSYPELIPNLSTCKSPQQMLGAIVKRHYAKKLGAKPEDICLVSVMPCTAKKSEADRPEMQRQGEVKDVDYVLTTRELGHIFRHKRVPLASMPEDEYDSPLAESSGAAVLFGATGKLCGALMLYACRRSVVLHSLSLDSYFISH